MTDSAPKDLEVVSLSPRLKEAQATIHAGAALTVTYVVMNALATIIACYGLLADSAAVIIGAMIIAMLLGPISGTGLALVENDMPLLRKSLVAELVGAAIVMAIAFLIGLLHRELPAGQEILSRTKPGSADLAVALAGGTAAAIATVSGSINLSLVGVAIATALVPPLSACSMLLARGEGGLALGAFLLAFTNMVAIQFASSVVFWVAGFHRTRRRWLAGFHTLRRNAITLTLLVLLAGLLAVSSHHAVRHLLFETSVRKTLKESVKEYPGAYLDEVRFETAGGKELVRAVIRSPRPLTANEVASMERRLPRTPQGGESSLRVRRVPVEVMTDQGPLFEPGEAPQAPSRTDVR
jgi:uncharacterized hydrophobic protein (TIGR00271 family)